MQDFFVFILLLFFFHKGGECHTKMHLFPEIDQDNMDFYFFQKDLFGCLFVVEGPLGPRDILFCYYFYNFQKS